MGNPASDPPWNLTPGMRIWVGGHDVGAKQEIQERLGDVARPPTGPIDAAFLAPRSAEEAAYFAAKLRPRLRPTGRVWIVCLTPGNAHDKPQANILDTLTSAMTEVGFQRERTFTLSASYCAISFRPLNS